MPATKVTSAPGHEDSDEEDRLRRLEEVDHGQGYEGDTSSGSGRSWGERSRRPRAGRRSRANSHGRRSPGGGSEANGLALVSGFKRLPRQDVQMRPVKSVLVRKRESDGEPWGYVVGRGLGVPGKGPHCCPDIRSCVVCGQQNNGSQRCPHPIPGPVDVSPHGAEGTLQVQLS